MRTPSASRAVWSNYAVSLVSLDLPVLLWRAQSFLMSCVCFAPYPCSFSPLIFLPMQVFVDPSSWWAQSPQPLCPPLPSVQWVSGNNVGLLLLTKSVLVFTAPFKLLPQEISQAHWQALISSRKYPSRKLKKERCAVIIFVLGSQDRGRRDIN